MGNGSVKLLYPFNVRLSNINRITNGVDLVGDVVPAVSVFDKLGKSLASAGGKTKINKSVDIGGYAVVLNAHTLCTGLVKLYISIEKR